MTGDCDGAGGGGEDGADDEDDADCRGPAPETVLAPIPGA